MVSVRAETSSNDITMLHCTEPFIITLTSSGYDLNNVERDVKHEILSFNFIIDLKTRNQSHSYTSRLKEPLLVSLFQQVVLFLFGLSMVFYYSMCTILLFVWSSS